MAFELTIMKSFLFILILIVASCINTSAQTDKIPSCPTIRVTGPTSAPKPDEPMIFTASLSEEAEKFNLQYNWTISGGEIIEGQGTLVVKASRKNIGGNLTLTLEVNGLPQGCKKTASETSFAPSLPPQIQLFDEFSIVPSRIDKARLDNFLTSLREDPSAAGYIIESFAKGTSRKMIQQKIQKVFGYLKKAGIEKDRIILLNCFSNKNLTQFYSVPAGAIPPTCDEHVFAK